MQLGYVVKSAMVEYSAVLGFYVPELARNVALQVSAGAVYHGVLC